MRTSESRNRCVYVVAGPAGSGKSTLGRALAGATGAVVLDQDIATNPLMSQLAMVLGAGSDLDHPALRGPVRQARYQCLVDVAVDNGRLGRDVVIIAPFTAECADARAWAHLTRQFAPARVALIWVTVPPEVALARRRRRNLARDVAAGSAAPPRPAAPPVVEHLVASGAAEPGREAARIVRLMRRPTPAAVDPGTATVAGS